MPISEVKNIDCMEGMKTFPDNFFDLAVVDPPYGIGEANEKRMLSRHHTQRKYKGKDWDNNPPEEEYFKELFRVSKNKIVWGANHFISLMPYDSSCWIYWDKDRYGDFADGELAWTSFKSAVRCFKWTWDGFRKQMPEDRFHPTQKPVALYDWIYTKYAQPSFKILDTHMGSQSSRIAAHRHGLDYWGYEIDKDYFEQGNKRYSVAIKQQRMF